MNTQCGARTNQWPRWKINPAPIRHWENKYITEMLHEMVVAAQENATKCLKLQNGLEFEGSHALAQVFKNCEEFDRKIEYPRLRAGLEN